MSLPSTPLHLEVNNKGFILFILLLYKLRFYVILIFYNYDFLFTLKFHCVDFLTLFVSHQIILKFFPIKHFFKKNNFLIV